MAKHYAHLEHLRRKDKCVVRRWRDSSRLSNVWPTRATLSALLRRTLVGWTRRKVHQLSTVVCIAELT